MFLIHYLMLELRLQETGRLDIMCVTKTWTTQRDMTTSHASWYRWTPAAVWWQVPCRPPLSPSPGALHSGALDWQEDILMSPPVELPVSSHLPPLYLWRLLWQGLVALLLNKHTTRLSLGTVRDIKGSQIPVPHVWSVFNNQTWGEYIICIYNFF